MTHEDQYPSESGEGNEFEAHMEALHTPSPLSHSQITHFPGRRDRFRVARLALYALALVAVVGAFALAPSGLGGALSSFGSALTGPRTPSAGSRAPALTARALPTPTATLPPTPVAYPTPTLVQGAPITLGQAPASCTPPAPAPRMLPATFSGAIGRSPVWVAWFVGSHATRHIDSPGGNSRYGWLIGVIFAVEPGLTDPVVVRGERLDDGSPLWFGQASPSVAVVLDPQQPGLTADDNTSMGLSDDWAAWDATLYIPAAGCYALDATWPGGSWRVTFAAGR